MKILLTGSEGLIGKPLGKRLRELGHKVITNDIAGNPDIKGSFVNVKINCDVVIHLAAIVGVDTTRKNPERLLKVNFTDTKKFIDRYKDKRFIFSSSSEVYGNSTKIPFNENDSPTPVSLYGSLKVVIENYLKEQKVNSGIVRFFNVYGAGQRDEFVIAKFIRFAKDNIPLEIYGDGKQIRCFTYIDDAVEGLIKVINYKSRYDIFNIGNSKKSTIREVTREIVKIIPVKIKYLSYGGRNREKFLEIQKRVPDVRKAKKLLQFKATTTLREGIKKTWIM